MKFEIKSKTELLEKGFFPSGNAAEIKEIYANKKAEYLKNRGRLSKKYNDTIIHAYYKNCETNKCMKCKKRDLNSEYYIINNMILCSDCYNLINAQCYKCRHCMIYADDKKNLKGYCKKSHRKLFNMRDIKRCRYFSTDEYFRYKKSVIIK